METEGAAPAPKSNSGGLVEENASTAAGEGGRAAAAAAAGLSRSSDREGTTAAALPVTPLSVAYAVAGRPSPASFTNSGGEMQTSLSSSSSNVPGLDQNNSSSGGGPGGGEEGRDGRGSSGNGSNSSGSSDRCEGGGSSPGECGGKLEDSEENSSSTGAQNSKADGGEASGCSGRSPNGSTRSSLTEGSRSTTDSCSRKKPKDSSSSGPEDGSGSSKKGETSSEGNDIICGSGDTGRDCLNRDRSNTCTGEERSSSSSNGGILRSSSSNASSAYMSQASAASPVLCGQLNSNANPAAGLSSSSSSGGGAAAAAGGSPAASPCAPAACGFGVGGAASPPPRAGEVSSPSSISTPVRGDARFAAPPSFSAGLFLSSQTPGAARPPAAAPVATAAALDMGSSTGSRLVSRRISGGCTSPTLEEIRARLQMRPGSSASSGALRLDTGTPRAAPPWHAELPHQQQMRSSSRSRSNSRMPFPPLTSSSSAVAAAASSSRQREQQQQQITSPLRELPSRDADDLAAGSFFGPAAPASPADAARRAFAAGSTIAAAETEGRQLFPLAGVRSGADPAGAASSAGGSFLQLSLKDGAGAAAGGASAAALARPQSILHAERNSVFGWHASEYRSASNAGSSSSSSGGTDSGSSSGSSSSSSRVPCVASGSAGTGRGRETACHFTGSFFTSSVYTRSDECRAARCRVGCSSSCASCACSSSNSSGCKDCGMMMMLEQQSFSRISGGCSCSTVGNAGVAAAAADQQGGLPNAAAASAAASAAATRQAQRLAQREEDCTDLLYLVQALLTYLEVVEQHRQSAVEEATRLRRCSKELSTMLQQANRREENSHAELRRQQQLLLCCREQLLHLQATSQAAIEELTNQRQMLAERTRILNRELEERIRENQRLTNEIESQRLALQECQLVRQTCISLDKEKKQLQAELETLRVSSSKALNEKNALLAEVHRLHAQIGDMTVAAAAAASRVARQQQQRAVGATAAVFLPGAQEQQAGARGDNTSVGLQHIHQLSSSSSFEEERFGARGGQAAAGSGQQVGANAYGIAAAEGGNVYQQHAESFVQREQLQLECSMRQAQQNEEEDAHAVQQHPRPYYPRGSLDVAPVEEGNRAAAVERGNDAADGGAAAAAVASLGSNAASAGAGSSLGDADGDCREVHELLRSLLLPAVGGKKGLSSSSSAACGISCAVEGRGLVGGERRIDEEPLQAGQGQQQRTEEEEARINREAIACRLLRIFDRLRAEKNEFHGYAVELLHRLDAGVAVEEQERGSVAPAGLVCAAGGDGLQQQSQASYMDAQQESVRMPQEEQQRQQRRQRLDEPQMQQQEQEEQHRERQAEQ